MNKSFLNIGFYLFLAGFLLINKTYSQNEQLKPVIEKILNASEDYNNLYNLLKNLKDSKNKYLNILQKVPCISPINPDNKQRVSSEYGKRFHPIDQKYKVHKGIDIATNIGTTVHSTAEGKISKIVFSKKGYGNYIVVKHKYGYSTKYAHLSLIYVLKVGQEVKLGEIIGFVGSTGKSTGNHLHYEILKNNKSINPKQSFGFREKIINIKF